MCQHPPTNCAVSSQPSLETGDTVIIATGTLVTNMGAVRESVASEGGEDARDKETLVGDQ